MALLDENRRKQAFERLVEMHYKSKVGHLGGNLSALDSLLILFHEILRPNDKFVLSKGHSIGALYAALWSIGEICDADLHTFHKDDTLFPGHTPIGGVKNTPFATGSLGHGFSLACGLSIGFQIQKASNRVYCLTSDGEWQEGSTWEALIFASHHKLSNLTVLVDQNGLQGFGSTKDVASMESLIQKLREFDVSITSIDGHNLDELRVALSQNTSRTHIIVMKTIKGFGVKSFENKMESHYLPINEEQYMLATGKYKK